MDRGNDFGSQKRRRSKIGKISQRTKEVLARKRAEGVVLYRPLGSKSSKTKLTGQEKKIQVLLDKKASYFPYWQNFSGASFNRIVICSESKIKKRSIIYYPIKG